MLHSFLIGASAFVLASPNGDVKVTFDIGENLRWGAERKGREVLMSSPIGLETEQGPYKPFKVVGTEVVRIDTVWTNRLYRKELVADRAVEHLFRLEEADSPRRRFDVRFRISDNSVAVRYELPSQKGADDVVVVRELTSWRFAGDPYSWMTAYTPEASGRINYSEESPFYRRPLRSGEGSVIGSPLVVESNGGYVALFEADLEDWGALYFSAVRQPYADSALVMAAPTRRFDGRGVAIVKCPCCTPWRVAYFADDACALTDASDVMLNLNPPPEGGDEAFDWVKPGASGWDWWYESNVDQGREQTLEAIDFAAEMGWPYHTIDVPWYGPVVCGEKAKLEPRKEMAFPELLARAREKKVGLWVWAYWSTLEQEGVERTFRKFSKWGIAGVKVDFMERSDQEIVRWYGKVVRLAAKYRLMVNFHAAYHPTGMNRTWPNQITREGVRGNEFTKFSSTQHPRFTATLPFTRFILGPGDYTPGGFVNVYSGDFSDQSERIIEAEAKGAFPTDGILSYELPGCDRLSSAYRELPAQEIGTRAHALALCVAYDSPLMSLCDKPSRYRGAAGREVLRNLPTVWRRTLPISGRIGEHYIVARESYDGRWFVAALGTAALSRDVDCRFLGEGSWTCSLYEDDPDRTPSDAMALRCIKMTCDEKDRIGLRLLPEGGAVAVFSRMEAGDGR